MTWRGDDRRRDPRVAAGFEGDLQAFGASPDAVEADRDVPEREADPHGPTPADRVSVKDISASGVCCRSDRALPEMSIVRLELLLPGEEGDLAGTPVRCAGAVVRSEPIPGERYPAWEVAVYFTDIAERDRLRIRSFVDRELARSDAGVGP